jgi:hypothetical protein
MRQGCCQCRSERGRWRNIPWGSCSPTSWKASRRGPGVCPSPPPWDRNHLSDASTKTATWLSGWAGSDTPGQRFKWRGFAPFQPDNIPGGALCTRAHAQCFVGAQACCPTSYRANCEDKPAKRRCCPSRGCHRREQTGDSGDSATGGFSLGTQTAFGQRGWRIREGERQCNCLESRYSCWSQWDREEHACAGLSGAAAVAIQVESASCCSDSVCIECCSECR